jgi:hypothetical protein
MHICEQGELEHERDGEQKYILLGLYAMIQLYVFQNHMNKKGSMRFMFACKACIFCLSLSIQLLVECAPGVKVLFETIQ